MRLVTSMLPGWRGRTSLWEYGNDHFLVVSYSLSPRFDEKRTVSETLVYRSRPDGHPTDGMPIAADGNPDLDHEKYMRKTVDHLFNTSD